MRQLLQLVAVLSVLAAAASPHVHAGHPPADEPCPACLVRGADVPGPVVPDLAPPVSPAEAVTPVPGLAPVTGAPLGAVPGQSPPAVA